MIAKYKGIKYKYVSNRRTKEIITRQQSKADKSFANDNGIFFKRISEDELSDIYSVGFYVLFDANLENVSQWWLITGDCVLDDGNKVKLRFSQGILPNWNVEEKNVCYTIVDSTYIQSAAIRYKYKKRDGIYVENNIEEKEISFSDLIVEMRELNESKL